MEKYLNHLCKIFELMLIYQLKKDWYDEADILKILKSLKE